MKTYYLKNKLDNYGNVPELKRRLTKALRLHQSDKKNYSDMVDLSHKVDEYLSN